MTTIAELEGVPKTGRMLIPERIYERADDRSQNYGSLVNGNCMEPEIYEGDFVVICAANKPRAGDIVILYPASGAAPSIKRLILGLPPECGPNSELQGLIIAEQLNPPRQYTIPADKVRAVHVVIGWMKPEEHQPLKLLAEGAPIASA